MSHNEISVFTRYQQITQKIGNQIAAEADSFILGSSLDDLVDYYYLNNQFSPIEIDLERTETVEVKKERKTVLSYQREAHFQGMGDIPYDFESIILRIPIKPHQQLETVKSMALSGAYPTGLDYYDIIWENDSVSLTIAVKGYGYNKPDEKVTQEIDNVKEWFITRLSHFAAELQRHNKELLDKIKQWIELRKTKIQEDNERYSLLLQKIKIPVRKKEDEVIKRIQIDTRPIVTRIRPTPTSIEDYYIDRQKVLDIIHVLDNQGRQFEKTPKTYVKSEEEDLRNVLLVNLNSIFEGKATGETFMAKGKTDIYLNIDKGNVLVFECKFWGGQKLYGQTIDQLLSYLTWRNNFGVIILFSRQKNFSNILTESKGAIQSHPSYQQGFQLVGETHYLSHHRLPLDNMKNVEVHHLFYNIHV